MMIQILCPNLFTLYPEIQVSCEDVQTLPCLCYPAAEHPHAVRQADGSLSETGGPWRRSCCSAAWTRRWPLWSSTWTPSTLPNQLEGAATSVTAPDTSQDLAALQDSSPAKSRGTAALDALSGSTSQVLAKQAADPFTGCARTSSTTTRTRSASVPSAAARRAAASASTSRSTRRPRRRCAVRRPRPSLPQDRRPR